MIDVMREGEGATPPTQDHPFEPKGEWWSLCRVCNLAESAHVTPTHPPEGVRRDE